MKLFWLISLCIFYLVQTHGKDCVYDGFKLYKLTTKGRSSGLDLSALVKNASYYNLFDSDPASIRIMVHPAAQAEFIQLLAEQSLSYKVVNRDVGLTLRREFDTNRMLRNWYPYNGRLETKRYYSHAEINQYIEDLAQQYPSRVSVKTVGKSYEGRYLKTIRITNGDGRANKNVILMDGGFHAREWISPAAVVYAIGELVYNYQAHADLLRDYDWIILPVVNPDGYEFSQKSASTRLWRKTRQPSSIFCIGTDPNRNFDFHWNESGTSPDPCSDVYAGLKAFSEPETVVVRDLIHSLADRGKIYLTVHSHGRFLLYPWGYNNEVPETWWDLLDVCTAGANAIKEVTGITYKIGQPFTVLRYKAAGGSYDYAFNAGFPISLTMELPGGGKFGFNPPASSIDRFVKETWVGIKGMALKVAEKYPLN